MPSALRSNKLMHQAKAASVRAARLFCSVVVVVCLAACTTQGEEAWRRAMTVSTGTPKSTVVTVVGAPTRVLSGPVAGCPSGGDAEALVFEVEELWLSGWLRRRTSAQVLLCIDVAGAVSKVQTMEFF